MSKAEYTHIIHAHISRQPNINVNININKNIYFYFFGDPFGSFNLFLVWVLIRFFFSLSFKFYGLISILSPLLAQQTLFEYIHMYKVEAFSSFLTKEKEMRSQKQARQIRLMFQGN